MIEPLNDDPSKTFNETFKTKAVFRNTIKLYPEISILNYLCSLCHYFVMTFIFVSVESL